MSDVLICRTCLSTTADGGFSKGCFDGPHDLVPAVVTECPHVRRDKNGTIRSQNRVKANRECEAPNHHPLLCQHVSVRATWWPDDAGLSVPGSEVTT